MKGPIAKGLTIDHLCRVRCCVNPDHMEVVSMKENTRRGTSPHGINMRKTHCINGHPFDDENTAHWTGKDIGKRRCRECYRIKWRRWRAKNPKPARA